MIGAGWMNLASLCLGVSAWVLPLAAFALRRKAGGAPLSNACVGKRGGMRRGVISSDLLSGPSGEDR